jgi:hypothetical protein
MKGVYPLRDFPHLRHLENEGLFNKKKFSDFSYLEFGTEPIQHSMFKLSTAYVGGKNKSKALKSEAKEIFKSIMGYMRDRFHAYPITLAHEVIFRGLEEPLLRDEIFIQLIKQTTKNPSNESLLLGWKLMYLCVKTFPPTTEEMEKVLLSHIAEIANPKLYKHMLFDSLDNVATNCYVALQDSISRGPKSEVPSLEEIRGLTESKALKLRVITPSGDPVEIPIAAANRDMVVSGALRVIAQKIYHSGSQVDATLVVVIENANTRKIGESKMVPIFIFIDVLLKSDRLVIDPNESVIGIISHWEGETLGNPDLRFKFEFIPKNEEKS